MRLAQNLDRDMVIDAAVENPAETVQKKIGVAHTVLVTAVSLPAFRRGANRETSAYLPSRTQAFRPGTYMRSL